MSVTSQGGIPEKVDSLLVLAQKEPTFEKRAAAELEAAVKLASYSVDTCIVLIDSLLNGYELEKNEFAIARAKSLKSWFISYQTRYEEGLKLAHEAMQLQEKAMNDSFGLARTYMRIALLYIHFEKLDECEKYFAKSERIFEEMRDTQGLDMVYNNVGAMNSDRDPQKAIQYYKRSLSLRKQIKDYEFWVAYSYYNIGSAYLRIPLFDSAYHYLSLAEYTFINEAHREVPPMVVLGFASYYFDIESYSKALEYCEIGLARAKERNHTEMIIEATHIMAETLNKLGKHAQAYETLKSYEELKNNFDSINNAAQVAELELKYNSAKKEQQIAQLESDKALHESELKQARWTNITISILAILLVLSAIFLFGRHQQKQKLHASQLEARLAEIRLIALRAQMNPHFIFNCINTAQYFVINAEKEAAYDYLANFAKLLRMVLENSGKTFVPLEDEIKQIRLYIELELIRFNEKFSYSISMDEDLENGVYEVPSMILQPLVENAILHGILNKEEDIPGKIDIELKLKDDTIQCIITDNGVGRKRAEEIKRKKSVHYQAVALPNIQERLSILYKSTDSRIHYFIEDVYDKEETGTRVILQLPIH